MIVGSEQEAEGIGQQALPKRTTGEPGRGVSECGVVVQEASRPLTTDHGPGTKNMATVDVRNLDGATVKQLELADAVFTAAPNQNLLWEAVKQYLASQRRGTHATKSRADVRGGGKKPWKQKGTGKSAGGQYSKFAVAPWARLPTVP